jgi:hypothetical protein
MEANLSSASAAQSKATRAVGVLAVVEMWVFKPLVQFLVGAVFAIGGLVNAEKSGVGGSADSKTIFFSTIAAAFLISAAILASRRRSSGSTES